MPPSLARHIALLATIALLLVCGSAAAQNAEDPMLARSELIAPERAPASEPIRMTFVIRSDAGEDALVSCWLNVGEQLLFTGTEKPIGGTFDRETRTWEWKGVVPAHGEVRIPFSVIATPWMAGFGRTVSLTAARTGETVGVTRGNTVLILEPVRHKAPLGVMAGPVLVGPNEFMLLFALVLAGYAGWRIRRVLPRAALVIAFGLWLVLTVVGLLLLDGGRTLVDDVRMLTSWRATSAVVLDAAPLYVAPNPGDGVGRNRTPHGSYVPMAAVRYEINGAESIAAGFWSTSHVFVSRRAARLVAPYAAGASTTCWVDPEDPRRFVLNRTPGLGHIMFFALAALVVLVARFAYRLTRAAPDPAAAPLAS